MRRWLLVLALCLLPYASGQAASFTRALKFSGGTQVVAIGATSLLNNLDPWTLAIRVQVTSLSTGGAFAVKGRAADNNRRIAFTYGGAGQMGIGADRATADMSYQTATGVITTNARLFVMGTFDSSNSAGDLARIYLSTNGGPLSQLTWSTATDGSGAFQSDAGVAMTLCNNSVGAGPAPVGNVWDITITNTELTLEEGVALMRDMDAPVRGLVGRWRMGANGTGRVIDTSGNNLLGTITGAIPVVEAWPRVTWRNWRQS